MLGLAPLCQKVWERLFITTSWFPASLPYPSFLSCGLARSKGVALLHFHPCDSLYHQYPNLPPFLLFSPPHGLQVTFQWTCSVRVGLVLACHRNLCIFICIFVLYHTWKALTLKQIFFQIFGTQVSLLLSPGTLPHSFAYWVGKPRFATSISSWKPLKPFPGLIRTPNTP